MSFALCKLVKAGARVVTGLHATFKVTAMNMVSLALYEEIVFRAGMQVSGGNLSLLPHADPASGDAAKQRFDPHGLFPATPLPV